MSKAQGGGRLWERWLRWQLERGSRQLQHGNVRAALERFTSVIERLEERYGEEALPAEAAALYGQALLYRARALAKNRSINAVAAYLRAREWTTLEPEDVQFVADHLLSSLPRSLRAFPIYLDWYDLAERPEEAEARLRHLATIKPDEDAEDSLFWIRERLNEYLLAFHPEWTWTLEHLGHAARLRGDLRGAQRFYRTWAERASEDPRARCWERTVAAERFFAEGRLLEGIAASEAALQTETEEAVRAARGLLELARSRRGGALLLRRVRRALDRFSERTQNVPFLNDYAQWLAETDPSASAAVCRRILELEPENRPALERVAAQALEEEDPNAPRWVERLLLVAPDAEEFRRRGAKLAAQAGQWEQVAAFLEPIASPSLEDRLLLARAQLQRGRFAAAQALLAPLEEDSLSKEEARSVLLLRGDLEFAQGRRAAALGLYRRAAERFPADPRFLYRIGRTLWEQGDQEGAAQAWSRLLEQDASHAGALKGRGFARLEQGNLSGAREDLERAATLRPGDPEVHYALGCCWIASDPTRARNELERTLALEPEHLGARLALAELAEKEADWAQAAQHYRKALSVGTSQPQGAIRRRWLYAALRAGEENQVLAWIQETPDWQPVSPEERELLGLALYRQGRGEEAVELWRSALVELDSERLRRNLSRLHLQLADRAWEEGRWIQMVHHWDAAREENDPRVLGLLVPRWAREAGRRLLEATSNRHAVREAEVAADLLQEVLDAEPDEPVYRLLAAIAVAAQGDWRGTEELLRDLPRSGRWGSAVRLLLGVAYWGQGLFDRALQALPLNREWSPWETTVHRIRAQIAIASGDVAGVAREIAMLRTLAPEACPVETAVGLFLHFRCWRHVIELVQSVPREERSDWLRYAHGVGALMCHREAEGLEVLQTVPEESRWYPAARKLLTTGQKRRALRALQVLGWAEAVPALEELCGLEPEDPQLREWLDRVREIAALTQGDQEAETHLTARWKKRLREDPTRGIELHQWAVYAYWNAQSDPTPERWTEALCLWGSLLQQEAYWRWWIHARLARHDPKRFEGPLEGRAAELAGIVEAFRQRLIGLLTSEATHLLLRQQASADRADDCLLEFLREYRTAGLWQNWLERNPQQSGLILPFGPFLLEQLGRLAAVRDVLSAANQLSPTPLSERLGLYLSPLGALMAAAETDQERLARERTQRLLNHPEPEIQRAARIVYALAVRNDPLLRRDPREGLHTALQAYAVAHEVKDSPLLEEIRWEELFQELGAALVQQLEEEDHLPPKERLERVASARERLRSLYELTEFAALEPLIVRISLLNARLLTQSQEESLLWTPEKGQALDILHAASAIVPENLSLQREIAALRFQRGLAAVKNGSVHEALVDFSRAFELDPLNPTIVEAYTGFLMDQAERAWMSPRPEVQQQALAMAYRVLAAHPSDPELIARAARFLSLPEGHPLRNTPEYRRLATLFLRTAHDRQEEDDEPKERTP
ncbi:MAG: hypothetical protein KatS3mg115_1902 [Candidatus Poribacteria bacterium]|nr:MAG: hypothetical protein KatS3mg115_1902 [Candidatus Poribacteria bacterium]